MNLLSTKKISTNVHCRTAQEKFRDQRVVYQNRVEKNRQDRLLSALEKEHRREQTTLQMRRLRLLADSKRESSRCNHSSTFQSSYEVIDLTTPQDFNVFNTRTESNALHIRSRANETRSHLIHSTRTKSASILSQMFDRGYSGRQDTLAPDKRSTSASIAKHSSDMLRKIPVAVPSNIPPDDRHTTWLNSRKIFAWKDEADAESSPYFDKQHKTKTRFSSKQIVHFQFDQPRESDVFITPKLLEEYELIDPIFAKRYQHLKSVILANRIPICDSTDTEINSRFIQTNPERARTALSTMKQTKIKHRFQNQQLINDDNLSKRIDNFLKRLKKFKQQEAEISIDE